MDKPKCEDCGQYTVYTKGLCYKCYHQDYYHNRVVRDGPRQTWPGYKPQKPKPVKRDPKDR